MGTWNHTGRRREKNYQNGLIANISLLSSDPLVEFPTISKAWDRFLIHVEQLFNLVRYEPVMREYFRQSLQEFYDDGVQYFELRFPPNSIFLLDGDPESTEFVVKVYKDVIDQFVKDNPDFSGGKLIYSSSRHSPVSVVFEHVKEAIALRTKYPDFVVGFDLANEEDIGHSLKYYLEPLLYPSQQDPPIHLPYLFHVAESNWQDTKIDYKIADALLLNTTRIGHGYGLIKHPKFTKMFKQREIPIEVNPISNQVLGLVKDLRNHAVIPMIANNFPIVISSDNFAMWAAAPLSYDFYVAFMAMSGRDDDLRMLKQLVLNSFKYSQMSEPERSTALQLWHTKWDSFINELADSIDNSQSAKCSSKETESTDLLFLSECD